MTAAPEDLDRVRRLVDEVRARPAFAEAEPSWLDRALERLGDLFDPILRRVGGSGAFDVLAWVVIGLVVAGALVWAVRAFLRRGGPDRTAVLGDDDVGRDPVDWLALARQHAEAGEHREAVRCHLRAGVAQLAAAGLLREVAGRTVGEYERELARNAPRRTAAFADAADVFEAVWYAGEEADAAHVTSVAAAVARLDRDERPADDLVAAP